MLRLYIIPPRPTYRLSPLLSFLKVNRTPAIDFPRFQTSSVHSSGLENPNSPPPLQYQWQEGVEDLESYLAGGYHPTHIGDRYNQGRYEIVHKLGFGSYSTVWLAKDYYENRFVALKIIVANASQDNREAKILRALASGKPDHPGRPFTLSLLNEFTISGPNGSHQWIVTEPVGSSAESSKVETRPWRFPVRAARAIGAQLLLGLDYIHSCGVVHGDLHPNNVLFRLPDYGTCGTVDDIYQLFGKPLTLPVQRLDDRQTGPEAPRYCAPPARTFQPCTQIKDDAQVVISDFGEAFFPKEPPKQLSTPVLLLPPEFIFHECLDTPVDMWTMGCTLYNLLGEGDLFVGFMPDEDHTVAEMISTLGNLPRRWWDCWQKKTDFFLDNGSWKSDTHRAHAPWSRPLTERMALMGRDGEFGPVEMACLEKLLRRMLTYEPPERITSKGAIQSEWMQNWGLPAIGGINPAASQSCNPDEVET